MSRVGGVRERSAGDWLQDGSSDAVQRRTRRSLNALGLAGDRGEPPGHTLAAPFVHTDNERIQRMPQRGRRGKGLGALPRPGFAG